MIHSKEKKHHCSKCNKCFSQKDYLVKHLLTHNYNSKLHECKECGKQFFRKTSLIRHQITHSGIKQYKCAECDKQFGYRWNLLRHEVIHLKKKQYKCPQGGKLFKQNDSLEQHKLIHKDKEYQCAECGRKFKQKNKLKCHIQVHLKKKGYQCSECNQKFRIKLYLSKHMLIHSNKKQEKSRYNCLICDEEFLYKSHLEKHTLVHLNNKQKKRKNDNPSTEVLVQNKYDLNTSASWMLKIPIKNLQKLGLVKVQNVGPRRFMQIKSLKNDYREEDRLLGKNKKLFYCCECSGQFLNKSDLEKHIVVHSSMYNCKKHKPWFQHGCNFINHKKILNEDSLQYDKVHQFKSGEKKEFIKKQNITNISDNGELNLLHKTIADQIFVNSELENNQFLLEINESKTDHEHIKKDMELNESNGKNSLMKNVPEHLQIVKQESVKECSAEFSTKIDSTFGDVESTQNDFSKKDKENNGCFICDQKFENKSSLQNHVLGHLAIANIQKYLDNKYTTNSKFIKEPVAKENKNSQEYNSESNNNLNTKCEEMHFPIYNKQIQDENDHVQHNATCSTYKRYYCKVCKRRFRHERDFIYHNIFH